MALIQNNSLAYILRILAIIRIAVNLHFDFEPENDGIGGASPASSPTDMSFAR